MTAHAINVDAQPIDELWDSKPHLAASLKSNGYDAIVMLDSDKAVAMAYGTPDGRLEFVHGSRALFDRYVRMTRHTCPQAWCALCSAD